MSASLLEIRKFRPDQALAALNRLTGLTWTTLPPSLAHMPGQARDENATDSLTLPPSQSAGRGLA